NHKFAVGSISLPQRNALLTELRLMSESPKDLSRVPSKEPAKKRDSAGAVHSGTHAFHQSTT
ncbi:MAG: hypothetical protein ACT4QE_07660, partial [Anaerolineales bacterium]